MRRCCHTLWSFLSQHTSECISYKHPFAYHQWNHLNGKMNADPLILPNSQTPFKFYQLLQYYLIQGIPIYYSPRFPSYSTLALVCVFIFKYFSSEKISELVPNMMLIISWYFSMYFLKMRTTLLYDCSTSIKIRKLTMSQYYHLVHRPHSNFTHCPTDYLYRYRIQSRNTCWI